MMAPMNLERRGKAWRARVYVNGVRDSATFPTKAQAVAWGQAREAELTGAKLPDKTVGDACKRYAKSVSPTHEGERWELLRLEAFQRDPLASVRLAAIAPADVAAWRDRRLQNVSGATVRREITLLQGVFGYARREWGWLRSDPLDGVKRPPNPSSRKRRVSQDEIDRITFALGYSGGPPANASQRVALAWLLAVETAMRSGEILGLRWEHVGAKSVHLPKTKNGDARDVPLTKRAREILALMPRGAETVFGLDGKIRDALFRKARARAGIPDLHFHDSRAEAIWRLSKKLDVLELARVIGHRDIKSLMIYYAADAEELADRLG